MTVFQVLLVLFLTVPLAEIYVFLQVGESIGIGSTIAVVVLTAVTGAALMRAQGLATLMRVQKTMARGGLPATELLEGAFLLVAGALLLTPGFLTDTVGFLCLVPALRRYFIQMLFAAHLPRPGDHSRGSPSGGRIIEGEVIQDSDRIDC